MLYGSFVADGASMTNATRRLVARVWGSVVVEVRRVNHLRIELNVTGYGISSRKRREQSRNFLFASKLT